MRTLLTLVVFATMSLAAGGSAHARFRAAKLPPKLRKLLKQEMRLIEKGMRQLLVHVTRGDGKAGVAIAEKVHRSFILKRSLTKAELKTLVRALPRAFVKLDRAFHGDGASLAKALRAGKRRSAAVIYTRMVRACVDCHVRFAPEVMKRR